MGTQMTKELGVYNEEERICTPRGAQQYRLLRTDPRSVTLGIARTPIQVECTPTGVKAVNETESVTKADCSCTEDSENKEEIEIGSDYIEIKNISPEPQVKYLETDIDRLDSPVSDIHHSSVSKEEKPIHALYDVRSPSLEIARTPVLVECTPELFALHSRIDSLSFCDFDVHSEDPSAIVSDDDQTSEHNKSSVNNWLDNAENKDCSDSPCNNSFTDSPKQIARKQKELTVLKKQLFLTPDVKLSTKPKVRTPLGNLQTGQLHESPQKLIQSKQWRNIQEERQRRGLQDTENTPPNLPPLSQVSSAPGKMLDRKRSKMNWDEENTMFI